MLILPNINELGLFLLIRIISRHGYYIFMILCDLCKRCLNWFVIGYYNRNCLARHMLEKVSCVAPSVLSQCSARNGAICQPLKWNLRIIVFLQGHLPLQLVIKML